MGSVLLIGDRSARLSVLNQALNEFGYQVIKRQGQNEDLLTVVSSVSPDILVIGLDKPAPSLLEKLALINKTTPLPVVMFVEQTTDNIVQQATRSGVNAYIVADLQPQRLKTIIDVAVARFQEYQSLKDELERTRSRLEDRKLLDKAKGLLMSRQGINEDQAYKKLRKMAMDNGKTLAAVARNVIDVFNMLEEKAS
ncbi:ANTAR domain-containing response regulator [Endozoicomonas sp. 8E]|uniref:ANTAR domain-containing response regulator n=1 Tax=Endozoicomonas sp. 8E TaxID=3035692 RepID=UPI00293947BD|nr:ANTAR domain-containing protein [Endozoicomonas sp. 8E]WOG26439.1 ANTAR domain-containing protein [Endozoicomonas sp. 8E]